VTALEYYLAVIFAAVWLVPAALAVRWELRLHATGKAGRASQD
jgi:hypothetical protein